jgi:hypothetical protein
LVTLNDSSFVEAANHLALKMMSTTGVENQIAKGYSMVTFRKISPQKLNVLVSLYQKSLTEYDKENIIRVSNDAKPSESQIKAMSMVASAILNLDEAITKE